MSRHRAASRGRFVVSKSLCSNPIDLWHPGCSCHCRRFARSPYPSTRAPQPRGWSAKPRVSSRDSLAVEGAEVGRPGRLTLVSSKELVMARLRLAAALIAVLAVTACTDSDSLTAPTGTL